MPKPEKRPAAYSNIGATGAIRDFVDDAEGMDFYVERLSNLPTSFAGIPENRARNLVRILEQYGARVELVPDAPTSHGGSQTTHGVTITALPKPGKDPTWPRNTRVMVCYSEYANVDGRVARLALLDLPASVEGLARKDAEEMIARIREVGGSAYGSRAWVVGDRSALHVNATAQSPASIGHWPCSSAQIEGHPQTSTAIPHA